MVSWATAAYICLMRQSKLLILGDGPVALSAALAASKLQFAVHLIRKQPTASPRPDPRAWAMRPATLTFLQQLGLPLEHQAPIQSMQVWHADTAGKPLAGQLDLHHPTPKALGAIVPNAPLRDELNQAIGQADLPTSWIEPTNQLPDPLELKAEYRADLALICDPAWQTALPKDHQPTQSAWTYDQIAVTAPIKLTKPHEGIARQVFLPTGPLALLPLPDVQQASMVWSLSPEKWRLIRDHQNVPELVRQYTGLELDFDTADLASFPLSAQHASTYLGDGFVLLGDAAHRIHPLAGQGLNLGLADVGALIDTLVSARTVGSDLGNPLNLEDFQRRRRHQNEAMRAVTDQLKHIFGQTWGPIRFARSLGMEIINQSPLKSQLVNWMSHEEPLSYVLTQLKDAPPQAA